MKNIAVIGGGISGISVAYFLDKMSSVKSRKLNIDIIEKHSEFAQDKISKFQYGQEIYDNGWHNSISGNGLLFQLMLELGLYRYLIKSKDTKKFLYTNEGIKNFPEKMLFGYPLDKSELIYSDIFTLREKFSIMNKLYKNSTLYNINTLTVEDFFLNKVNDNVYKKVIEPLLTNYFGSDISRQSFSLLMSDLAFAAIQNSDVKNVVRDMYNNKKTDDIMFGETYRLKFTLRSFLENLESYFSNRVFVNFNSEVSKIEKQGNRYAVYVGNKKYIYDYVIVAVKHMEFLPWFQSDRRLQRYYKDIKFVSNIVVTLICDKEELQINPDLGDLILDAELNKNITSIEYVSNKWVDIRAKNIHMLRVYINRQEIVKKLLTKSDDEITDIILKELDDIHGKIDYDRIYVTRAENNYVYADTKYSKYIHEVGEYLSATYENLYLIGNSKKAINLDQTIFESREVARSIIEKIK